jgi:hypothetical protein
VTIKVLLVAFAAAFFGILTLGLVLLIATTCKWLRANSADRRGCRATTWPAALTATTKPRPTQMSSQRLSRRADGAHPPVTGVVIQLVPRKVPHPRLP